MRPLSQFGYNTHTARGTREIREREALCFDMGLSEEEPDTWGVKLRIRSLPWGTAGDENAGRWRRNEELLMEYDGHWHEESPMITLTWRVDEHRRVLSPLWRAHAPEAPGAEPVHMLPTRSSPQRLSAQRRVSRLPRQGPHGTRAPLHDLLDPKHPPAQPRGGDVTFEACLEYRTPYRFRNAFSLTQKGT